jgi:hypothetical protein
MSVPCHTTCSPGFSEDTEMLSTEQRSGWEGIESTTRKSSSPKGFDCLTRVTNIFLKGRLSKLDLAVHSGERVGS